MVIYYGKKNCTLLLLLFILCNIYSGSNILLISCSFFFLVSGTSIQLNIINANRQAANMYPSLKSILDTIIGVKSDIKKLNIQLINVQIAIDMALVLRGNNSDTSTNVTGPNVIANQKIKQQVTIIKTIFEKSVSLPNVPTVAYVII
ncbi:hypothetical protein WN66_05215 [Saccharomyces cerevisiae]|uniref:Putative uncharacterized protein YNL319W n=1 Tax=Saccharomyces cerevisiae (strain ATCC 204508 / S288c) TaxID=559292 RepID=YN59_YEAST|nr:RecName: Full=Putative uncharacterized protein YNL319W; Flags: Precursor [Saccharomyces cerevisiae S288C]KZV08306.1 hypothetical protein WN66_05215 [Saccharomyces cerevisiae]CAA96249.1 unnamed protein product [Saccharomyces cerevisiae]